MKAWVTRASVIGACAIAVGVAAYAADHKDSPSVSTDHTTDITDVYTFKDGANLVLVMDVNGFSGPVATEDFRFSTTAVYYFHINTDSDVGTDEKKFVIQFADKASDGTQWIRVRGTGHGTGSNDDLVGEINTAADSNSPKTIASADGAVKVFAGPREDPFFFSLLGNGGNYKGFTTCTTGSMCFLGVCDRTMGGAGCLSGGTAAPYPADAVDTFAGFNVSSIVMEIPLTDLAAPSIGVWASTAQ